MAVADHLVVRDCHEQKSKKEVVAGGETTKSAAAKLHIYKEKEMGEMTFCIEYDTSVLKMREHKVPETVILEEEEPELYKEWREREKKHLEYLEEVTSNPKVEQERFLKYILKKNANCVYLQQFGLNGATDVDTFRELVPVCEYDRIRPFIQRIMKGEITQVLSRDPVVELLASSGTSDGESKLYPITEEDKCLRAVVWRMMRPILNRQLPGLHKGKCMFFYYVMPGCKTEGGLLRQAAVASFIKCKEFKQRPFDPSYVLSSPDEIIEARNYEESMYCHLLCGLLQREEVLRMGSIFSSSVVRSMRNLEEWWPEICLDLANGTLSETKVQSDHVKAAMQPYLRADPKLAEFVRQECSKKSWEGIIRRLWPNCMIIDTVCTGAMEAYTPILCHFSGNLPLVCTQLYAASEGYFGLNFNPLCPPEEIYYTLMPSVAYYEFIPVSGSFGEDNCEVLDLTSVKEGQEYEILVTTVSGLCRYRVGDILKVVGFYNSSPTFQFVRRRNTVLCVDTDKTDEKELHEAVTKATKLLEDTMGLRLQDYTSTVDMSSVPPHYVIFLELRNDEPIVGNIPTDLLEQCCIIMELSLNAIYRRNRAHKLIAPVELRILKEGTFERLAQLAYSRGASPSQYKTPRGLNSKLSAQLEIVSDGVLQEYSCQSCPPVPAQYLKH